MEQKSQIYSCFCEHAAVFTSAEDAVHFHKTTERTACQKSAPLVLHPHCSFLRHTRCIIYGFCNCLHMQRLLWNLLQKLSKMIVSFLVVPGVLMRLSRQRILIPWQTDANFHPFLSFLQKRHYVG